MKTRHSLVALMLLFCLSFFGQQPKTVSIQGQPQKTSTQVPTNQQESILQLQAENEAMQKQLEKMEKDIELYRGDVRTKIAEIDDEQSRRLTFLAIIMGLIGVLLGVCAPYFINKDNRKRLEGRFSEMKEDLKDLVKVATEQAGAATSQANNAKDAFNQMQPQIKSVTEQLASATEQVREATIQAVKAETASGYMQTQMKSITEQVSSATVQAMIATEQTKQAKQAVEEIEKLKKQVSKIQEKINQDTIAAEKAANEAKASQLFTQAYAEKDPSKAVEIYTQVIEINPDDAMAYNNRAFDLLTLGKLDRALNDVNVAIEKDSNDDCFYDTRGQIYMAMGRNEDALIDLNHALSINANYIEGLGSRSKCYRKLAEAEQDPARKADLIAKAEADEKKAESLKEGNKL